MSIHNGNTNENGYLVIDPTNERYRYQKIKEPLKFILQCVYLSLVFFPLLFLSAIKTLIARERSLKGQTVLVTGGAHGLGKELCFKFASLGCSIACVDINDKGSRETVIAIKERYPGVEAHSYHCDVRSKHEIRILHEHVKRDFQHLDILVHNAGDVTSAYLIDFEDKFLDNMIDLNLKSHFLIYREFLPEMIKRNKGHIVAIASLASVYSEMNFSIYTATKHGVLALMESLHLELRQIPHNKIKTSIVCPYFINTNVKYMQEWDLRFPGLQISTAVEQIVSGVRKGKRLISIPSILYSLAILLRLLPYEIADMIKEIVYVRLTPTKQTKVA